MLFVGVCACTERTELLRHELLQHEFFAVCVRRACCAPSTHMLQWKTFVDRRYSRLFEMAPGGESHAQYQVCR